MSESMFNLSHPYSRYGLAVALLHARLKPENLSETNVPEILAQAIESGLEHFRLSTSDIPQSAPVLRYAYIKASMLKEDRTLVFTNGLSERGIYLAPTVITNEIDQQQGKIIQGSHDNAVDIIEKLRIGTSLWKKYELSRSFAPMTSKINNGGPQKAPQGTLFEAACSIVATLTNVKPAAKIIKSNTTILPDLPLSELCDFVELFQVMMNSNLDGNLYEAKLPPKSLSTDAPPKKRSSQKKESKAQKSEYRRPRLHQGNYPFAPRNAAFGAVGLLAAIGRWAIQADEITWASRVLDSIGGTEERSSRPLYIISYESIFQVQFTHYIVSLSKSGKLSQIIDALTRETMLYADFESSNPSRYSSKFETNYKLFDLMASRFLQLFTLPAFRDFLATRAEYPQDVQSIFQEYFMNARKINKEIVESARALGQWLNRTAYIVADSEVKQETTERSKKVQKEKAKILVEFESAAMSAKTPQDMLHRISTRAGRLLQWDAPAEATRFYDATNSGEIEPEDALHLLIAYMRLRATPSIAGNDDAYSVPAGGA